LLLKTELGLLYIEPLEIAVIPRGVKFSVELPGGPSKGYLVEIYRGQFRLPSLGVIGSNSLANPHHFLAPVAWYEDKEEEWTMINKFGGAFH
jgi:homogentisate 1,2-dioxygenase